jgi:hypothetical protein
MFLRSRVAPRWVGVGALVLTALGGGCQRPLEPGDVQFQLPPGWRTVPVQSVKVPGTPLVAWSSPRGASLVVYRTLPIPGGTAASLADELTNRLANLPELTIVAHRTETWNGHEAARVEAIAPGTGNALAPSGTGVPVAPKGSALVPTHRVALGFPRQAETLWIAWHYPEAAHAAIAPEIEGTLKSLRLPAASYGY